MNQIIKKEPLVSIIINNYNYEHFLSDAIDSALNQIYPHIEVIVVDDGSTDNSRELINSYGNNIIKIFKENGGQASALNAGFVASKGDIICLLDADDIFLTNKVSEVVDCFNSDASVAWVFHDSFPKKTEDIENKKSTFTINNGNQDELGKIRYIDFRNNILNAELPTFTPSTSNLCFSKKILENIFPLPEVKGFSRMAITDYYIKYLAVGLGTGCVINKKLGIFRLHNNTYSNSKISIDVKRKMYSEMQMMTAYWIRIKFPIFYKLSNKLFSKGYATYLKSKSSDLNYEKEIKEYLSKLPLIEKIVIKTKTFLYFIKLGFIKGTL